MKKLVMSIAILMCMGSLANAQGNSVYPLRPVDTEAHYFDVLEYGLKADGKTDVSDALQKAINKLEDEDNFGILYIPEGKYLISKTIYIPSAIRLIGYGKKRPEMILADNAPGFDRPNEPVTGGFGSSSVTNVKYFFFFSGRAFTEGEKPADAGAGTFYSAMSNINIRIGKGNPYAAAFRTHYAQHSFLAHIDIHIGDAFAGIVEVGNEMEDIRFFGGQYGIHTMMCSPSWPMMMTDIYFEGQSKASIHSLTGALTCVNNYFKNTPIAYEIMDNEGDRMIMDECTFENVSEAALVIGQGYRGTNQVNILNTRCHNVPVLVKHFQTGEKIQIKEKDCLVEQYTYGLCASSLEDPSDFKEIVKLSPLSKFVSGFKLTIPALPSMDTWVSVKDFGAKGDGETDDTEAIKKAVASAQNIYFPQGMYVLTSTVQMKENTSFIGLHTFGTQFVLKEATPNFSGFGGPVAMIESSKGGKNIFNGIGINTGANNYRAAGIKWMANGESYLNDVKFVGGHGTLTKGPYKRSNFRSLFASADGMSTPTEPVNAVGPDIAWDTQYWSLWITDNGGGTFKCIWSANSYASNGLFINNTSTPSKILAISIEHHVRSEVRMDNVRNWKIYDIQTEEEGREGPECSALELVNCQDLTFYNTFMMRVYRLKHPSRFAIRTWDCRNIEFYNVHNYGQNRYTANTALLDVNTGRNAPSWEMARLTLTGKESVLGTPRKAGKVEEISHGYLFSENLVADSKGNIYFSEALKKAIYKYNPATKKLTLFAEFPWAPIALGMDTKNNLLVVVEYTLQPGLSEEGEGAVGSIFNGMGTFRKVMSMNTLNPDNTTAELPRVSLSSVSRPEGVWYPTSRCSWRGLVNSIADDPAEYFMAPDKKTYIGDVGELARCSSLSLATPSSVFYTSDENQRRFLKLDVTDKGTLKNPVEFAPRGEFAWETDKDGNVYIADGHIYVYNKGGEQINVIEMPERPTSILFVNDDYSKLYVTSRNGFYRIDL